MYTCHDRTWNLIGVGQGLSLGNVNTGTIPIFVYRQMGNYRIPVVLIHLTLTVSGLRNCLHNLGFALHVADFNTTTKKERHGNFLLLFSEHLLLSFLQRKLRNNKIPTSRLMSEKSTNVTRCHFCQGFTAINIFDYVMAGQKKFQDSFFYLLCLCSIMIQVEAKTLSIGACSA